MNEHIEVIETPDPWEIIVRFFRKNKIEEKSLKIDRGRTCPVCFYPQDPSIKCRHHPGLENITTGLEITIGHFYKLDFNGNPLNWYSKKLKTISEYPYKFSHNLFKGILTHRIKKSGWDVKKIKFATMVPTNNHQMLELFRELAVRLKIHWIDPDLLFIAEKPIEFQEDRGKYVERKYKIANSATRALSEVNAKNKEDAVLLFDDVLSSGFTISRIMELLSDFQITQFKVVVVGRTIKRSLLKTKLFPERK